MGRCGIDRCSRLPQEPLQLRYVRRDPSRFKVSNSSTFPWRREARASVTGAYFIFAEQLGCRASIRPILETKYTRRRSLSAAAEAATDHQHKDSQVNRQT
jgi:hypothetical protein